MRLICLNTWGGRAGSERLLAFLDSHRDADFICLQEVWSGPYEYLQGVAAGAALLSQAEVMVYGKQAIGALLDSHRAFFHPHCLNNYGLMTLVSKRLEVVELRRRVCPPRARLPPARQPRPARPQHSICHRRYARRTVQRHELSWPLERTGQGRQRRAYRAVAAHPRLSRLPAGAVRPVRRLQSSAGHEELTDA